jgi:hypothetical protein
MEDDRFDRLTRIFAPAPSRRRVLGLALSGLAAHLGQERGTVKAKGKACSERCGPCRKCNRSTNSCQPKADGTHCANGQICQGGVCGLCASQTGLCQGGNFFQCGTGGANDVCFCDRSVEGTPACIANFAICVDQLPCNTSRDCLEGSVCVQNTSECCLATSTDFRFCAALCPEPSPPPA